MSASDFYLSKGYTQEYRYLSFAGAGTLALWTPRGSARVVVTGLTIASNLGGSVDIGWSASSAGKRVAQFFLGGSSTISPVIGSIEGTGLAEILWANVSQAGTNGVSITATGFEIPN